MAARRTGGQPAAARTDVHRGEDRERSDAAPVDVLPRHPLRPDLADHVAHRAQRARREHIRGERPPVDCIAGRDVPEQAPRQAQPPDHPAHTTVLLLL
jgi:hypothetical protein